MYSVIGSYRGQGIEGKRPRTSGAVRRPGGRRRASATQPAPEPLWAAQYKAAARVAAMSRSARQHQLDHGAPSVTAVVVSSLIALLLLLLRAGGRRPIACHNLRLDLSQLTMQPHRWQLMPQNTPSAVLLWRGSGALKNGLNHGRAGVAVQYKRGGYPPRS